MHKKFSEYLDQKGTLVSKPPVKEIPDYEGKTDSAPPKEKMPKDAGGKGSSGDHKPYKPSSDAKDPNKGKNTDGFAGKGNAKLKYEPDTDIPAKVGEGGTKKATWPKTKTQEWLDSTKGMNLAEFTKSLRSETVDECACQYNYMKETLAACKCNKKQLESFVREAKRTGLFGPILAEMLKHKEGFSEVARIVENEDQARRLVRALSEMVGPPMGGEENPFLKKKKKNPLHATPGDGSEIGDKEMSDVPPEGDNLGLDGGDEMGDDLGGEDELDGEMGGDELGGDEDIPHGDLEDAPPEEGDMGDMGMDAPALPPKKKKKHGIHHILGAMKDNPSMHAPLKAAMSGM